MTTTAKKLGAAGLGTALTTLYTTPGSTTAILKSFDVANYSSSSAELHVYIAAGTAAATDAEHIIVETVPGKHSYGWEGEQVLSEGMTLQASASPASACAIRACGVEII